jgi:hypothetical protein
LALLKSIKDSNSEPDWYFNLTSYQKESIERGLANHENNETLTSDEFWKG